MGAVRQLEARLFARARRQPPSSLLGRLAFWLALATSLASLARSLPGLAGTLASLLFFVWLSALLIVLVPLLWRLTLGRLLWKVQNRLIATYLLMGLAPVVLFVALFSIASYIFLGQFAVFAASSEFLRIQQGIAAKNFDYAVHLSSNAASPAGVPVALPEREHPSLLLDQHPTGETEFRSSATPTAPAAGQPRIAAFLDGKPMKLSLPADSLEDGVQTLPGWLPLHFEGWVLVDSHFFVRAVDTVHKGDHTVTVVSSLPVNSAAIARVAAGLGRITIIETPARDNETAPVTSEAEERQVEAAQSHAVSGGTLRPSQHFFDVPVNFFVPLDTVDWTTGKQRESGVRIVSRPTLLFQRLFITSLQVATYVQWLLIGLAIFFGVIELVAFLMAMRLNRTITQSISQLYAATLAMDRREFRHRIEVRRRDQLAALASSFNTMASSLERLVEEQREKERLQGELEIAQQVQANLFPQGQVLLPTLEVFGVCQPARTVSGDYYDFLVSGSNDISIALGDISGKGISAALLMATLHSAVHAYRFAGEDFRSTGAHVQPVAADLGGGVAVAEPAVRAGDSVLAASFAEPGQIMALLNRHLYRSTQPEKYATLFLAHYNGVTSELTYSTGGQLPPLLLRASGEVVRLDCGGTVVGLLDGMSYDQGREHLQPGDIVVAYSDGVTEPENEFGDFGEERLLEVVRLHRELPLEAIAERVLQAIHSWIGTAEQPDDITLVLARQR